MKFLDLLNTAIDDLLEHGFDSKERLDRWLAQLATAARFSLVPERKIQVLVRSALDRAYKTTVGKLSKTHRGIDQFTLQNVKPKLRAELDRRIHASADLITLNRNASIARTLSRFAGWATSVPKGGALPAARKGTKQLIRRGIAALPFEERRVVIDQGHKLVASINEIVAIDGGAIAATWRHIGRHLPEYDARPNHVLRDGKVYLYRQSWARARGLVKPIGAGFTDEVTQPAEEPFCSCHWEFIYNLRDLPDAMLTAKGKAALADAREKLKLLRAS